jgi:hypothetical protein
MWKRQLPVLVTAGRLKHGQSLTACGKDCLQGLNLGAVAVSGPSLWVCAYHLGITEGGLGGAALLDFSHAGTTCNRLLLLLLPQVKGKCNAISIDKCKKTGVVFEDVIASCELVNCNSIQVITCTLRVCAKLAGLMGWWFRWLPNEPVIGFETSVSAPCYCFALVHTAGTMYMAMSIRPFVGVVHLITCLKQDQLRHYVRQVSSPGCCGHPPGITSGSLVQCLSCLRCA